MSDRELLELAAKAAGIKGIQWNVALIPEGDCRGGWIPDGYHTYWNPLTDDGDALRLAVKLRMTIITLSDSIEVNDYDNKVCGQEMTCDGQDKYAATRRAIVRAAAEIVKGML